MKKDFVPDSDLKKRYKGFKHVHFGFMPSKLKV